VKRRYVWTWNKENGGRFATIGIATLIEEQAVGLPTAISD
jgi:hypothetical protein